MIETIIMGRVAKISFEVLYSIKLARSGAYERALDTLKSADIIHGIIILIGDIGALLRKYSDSKFAKLYIMAELFKEFRGIFVIENPIDSGKNYMNEALYIDKKFPKEYERIMGLTIVIDGFKKLDTQVKNVFILNYKDNKNRNKASFPIWQYLIGIFIVLSVLVFSFFAVLQVSMQPRQSAKETSRRLAKEYADLEKVYSIKLSDERVLWENPDKLSMDTNTLPTNDGRKHNGR